MVPTNKGARTFGLPALVAMMAALVVLGIGAWQILRAREAVLRGAEDNIGSLARSLAQHAARTVDGVDLTLADAVEQVEAEGSPGSLSSYLARHGAALKQARDFLVVDRTGMRLAGSAPSHGSSDEAGGATFQWHRDHIDRTLRIGLRAAGLESGIPVSRRIDAADGSFAGVASAVLAPDYFERFYRGLGAGPRSALGLWLDDGRLLIRYPDVLSAIGLPGRPDIPALFQRSSGYIRRRSTWDGIDRLFAFEHVPGLPLVVSAAVAVDDVLAPWRREALSEAAVVGAATLLLAILGFGLEWHRRRFRALDASSREADRQYRLLADNSHDLIVLKPGFDGHRSYVSPSARTVVGWEPAELAVLPVGSFLHPDDQAGARAAFAALTAANPVQVNVARVRHKAGHYVWLETLMRRTEDGRALLTARDITARRAAEQALGASEARYRLLAHHTTDMISHLSLGGLRLFVSPGCRGVTGYEPDELIGSNPLDATHPDDRAALRTAFHTLASGQCGNVSHCYRIRHKLGEWLWVEASLNLIREPTGAPSSVVASVRNVMERRMADTALRESEARYRVLAETTSDVITQLDLTMRRRYVSPACRHVLGFEPGELLGQRPSEAVHPDDAEALKALAARLASGAVAGDRAAATYRTLHKDGRWVWVEAGLNLVRDEITQAPLSIICSLRDVTERQRLTAQMQRAKEEAEEAVQVKSDFLANMSHELRTPLTGILGIHDLLKRDAGLGPGQRRLVELASDAGASLLAIVNDVLDLSKIEAQHLTLEAVPFAFADLVAGCRSLACRDLRGKPIAVRVELSPEVPRYLKGDPTRLRQILLNLLTNAVKFTERGEILLQAEYRARGGLLRIDVTDTGIGIPAELAKNLFERFTQADTSMSRRYGGTGLGLAICKRLVALMHGRIGVLPTAQGAHFWLEVPLAASPVRSDGRAATAQLSTARGAGRHLLLAEDNAVNAEIIATMLRAQQFRVSMVDNGAAAVAMIAAGSDVDLVLMDLQMPLMDGFEATAAIRAHEAAGDRTRLPILGLTANAFAEDAARCRAVGMDGHVAKPILWPVLFQAIEGCLRSGVEDDRCRPAPLGAASACDGSTAAVA